MIPRAQVEQVLEEHGVCVCGRHNYVVLKKRSDVSHYEGLLDDLCALPCAHPTPSREALEKLLMTWESRIIWHKDFQKGKSVIPERLDELMAWATGQEARRWCAHITSTTFMGQTVWLYQSDDVPKGVVFGMNMEQCPLCAKTRPVEPS